MRSKHCATTIRLSVLVLGTLTLAVAPAGCAVSADERLFEFEEGDTAASEQKLSEYVTPGSCTVGTVKTNRQLLALNCVDWAFRQATSDGKSFDWVSMSTLKVGERTYVNGQVGARAACQAVPLPKQADLTCVQATPPIYTVKIR